MKRILILISIMAVGCATEQAEPSIETAMAQALGTDSDVEVTPEAIEAIFGPITNNEGCQTVTSCGVDGQCDVMKNCCFVLGDTRCCQACINDVCRPLQCAPAGPRAPNNPPEEPLAPVPATAATAAAEPTEESIRALLGDDYAKTTMDGCQTTTMCPDNGPCVQFKSCCWTVAETRCCQACFDGVCRAVQCGPAGPTAPNNPPSDPLAPEESALGEAACTNETCELQAAAESAHDDIPPKIMAMFDPTGDGPVTQDCVLQLPDGPLNCCYISGITQCCCRPTRSGAYNCRCDIVIPTAPNNPTEEPIVAEPTAETLAMFFVPTEGDRTAQTCYRVITGEGAGLNVCCETVGQTTCCVWSNGHTQCGLTTPISPNNPPSAP